MARKNGGREATTGVIEGQYVLGVGNPGTHAPEGWRWIALRDVARLESGHTPSRKKPEYWGGEIPWIGIKDATGNHGQTIHETMQHTNDLGIANSAARVLPANTVCLSRTASVGYVVIMGRPMATSQDFANWVCSDKLDYRYLKFALLAERDSFSRFSYGSTHQTIYYPELKAFHICLPPMEEQKRIADILQSLDDKIELNRRMSATLEEMARALYRSWFVDFDPVHARALGQPPVHMDSTTAGLFPDSFGPDGLPKGWREEPIIDLASWVNGAAYKNMHFSRNPEALPVVKIAELKSGITSGTKFTATDLGAKYRITKGELLFSWSGNPDTSIDAFIWPHDDAWLNQHIFAVRENGRAGKALLFAMLRFYKPEFAEIARNKQTTGLGHITRKDLEAFPVRIPTLDIARSFEDRIEPLFKRYQNCLYESISLATLRDTLIPRLMSGELRIREAEKQVEEAV